MEFLIEKSYKDINYSAQEMGKLIKKYKVIVLRDYGLDEEPLEFFTKFTDQIGKIHDIDEDLLTGNPTGKRWVDITYDPAIKDKYRSAPVAQPLHTDASYENIEDNVQFFYCVSQAKLGGATVFIDANNIVELLEMAGETELLEDIQSHTIKFSKGPQYKNSPILKKKGDKYHFNWNYYCGDPENSVEEKELFERFHNFLETRVVKSGLVTDVLLGKNDVVFFHDELVLHGRNSYFATEKGQRSLNKGTILLN